MTQLIFALGALAAAAIIASGSALLAISILINWS